MVASTFEIQRNDMKIEINKSRQPLTRYFNGDNPYKIDKFSIQYYASKPLFYGAKPTIGKFEKSFDIILN